MAIVIFSVADDVSHVAWPWHLAFQILLGGLVYSAGMQLEIQSYLGKNWEGNFGWLIGLVGVIAWVVLIMNAINWSDGTDGLMPGVALLSFGTIFLLALRPEVNQPTVAILGAMLLGLSLGLLLFNWYPAKILSGTGGAYFFGFTLAVLALYAGMKVATLLLVLAVPVFDALFVFIRRIVRGHSPFLPDKEHLHHLLLARGWQPSSVATVYLAATGGMSLLALSLEGGEKAILFLVVGILFAAISVMLHTSLRAQFKQDHSL
jgi:UDP-GlcNAc:undecaprenyl-phosphate GlcNAc-1-phosphate transferase